MASRRPRSRARRRETERAGRALARDLERLAALEPGGAPERPVSVGSPAQIEVIAAHRPCPLCRGTLHVAEHAATSHAGVRLRVVRARCTRCGVQRSIWFTLATTGPH